MKNEQDTKDKSQAERIAAEEGLNPAELKADISAQMDRKSDSQKNIHQTITNNDSTKKNLHNTDKMISYSRMWIFLGLATVAGIVIGRFLKSFF